LIEKRIDFRDIRDTGDEAERLLRSLEESDAQKLQEVQPTSSSTSLSKRDPWEASSGQGHAKGNAHPGLVILIILLLSIPVIAVVWSGRLPSRTTTSEPALSYQKSCGSTYTATGRWWPVLGPSSRVVLARVKQNYCGDAYFNEEGSVQVASFGTRLAAQKFRDRLTDAMGVQFRVGRGR